MPQTHPEQKMFSNKGGNSSYNLTPPSYFDTFVHMAKTRRLQILKQSKQTYGGELLKKRKNRLGGRPLATRHSMHFVLRSSQARGPWSFLRHRRKILDILERFAVRHGVRLHSMANVGNHLHLHLQLGSRHGYKPFIRAITSAVMMAVTGASRWRRVHLATKFWDRRPFSQIVFGFKAFLRLKDYIAINQYEAEGNSRKAARFYVHWSPDPPDS
jgi:REP element-mobilizing transposase RayT